MPILSNFASGVSKSYVDQNDELISENIQNHSSNNDIHTNTSEKQMWNNKIDPSTLSAHTDDSDIHTSTLEKQAWNKKADPIPETSDTATAEVTQAMGETASYQFGTLTSLTLSGTRPSETVYYAYSIAFSSGSTPTTISVPEGWAFSGDDCTDGVFVPVASKAYEMIGAWEGTAIRWAVRAW